MTSPLLEVAGLAVSAGAARGPRTDLVRDVSFSVGHSEVVCLVGESGSGKSVTSQAIMGLIQQQRGITVHGEVRFEGRNLLALRREEVRALRGRDMAMVFQEPMSSLDPVQPVAAQLTEALRRRERVSKSAALARSRELLTMVGISGPDRCLRQYPHQLSGGMCQRVMIAMALAGRPRLLIADEPTTALDVTIQAQILRLLRTSRAEFGMSVLLVTHDMGVAAELADRIVVMYAGRVIEQGTTGEVFRQPSHPYTAGLLACIPRLTGELPARLAAIPGSVPEPHALPAGCAFRPRCQTAVERCADEEPPLARLASRQVACWRAEETTGMERHAPAS